VAPDSILGVDECCGLLPLGQVWGLAEILHSSRFQMVQRCPSECPFVVVYINSDICSHTRPSIIIFFIQQA